MFVFNGKRKIQLNVINEKTSRISRFSRKNDFDIQFVINWFYVKYIFAFVHRVSNNAFKKISAIDRPWIFMHSCDIWKNKRTICHTFKYIFFKKILISSYKYVNIYYSPKELYLSMNLYRKCISSIKLQQRYNETIVIDRTFITFRVLNQYHQISILIKF